MWNIVYNTLTMFRCTQISNHKCTQFTLNYYLQYLGKLANAAAIQDIHYCYWRIIIMYSISLLTSLIADCTT